MIRALAIGTAFLTSVSAQQTLVVDVAGTTAYQQIQAAITAANAGDVIQILPGVYAPFTCNKALRIQGSPGVVVAGSSSTFVFEISGIPANSTCTVSQLALRSPVVPCICEPLMQVDQCSGAVLLDAIGPDAPGSLEPQLHVTDSAGVLVNDSTIGPCVISDSSVQLTRTNVLSASKDAGNIVTLTDANFEMTDGSLWIRLSSFGYGLHLTNSTARLRLVNSLNVTNSFPGNSWELFGDAQSTVEWHPQVSFPLGAPTLGPFTNPLTVVVTDDMPSLTAVTAGLGGTVDVHMNYTPAVGVMVPFLSTPGGPFQVPGIAGDLFAGGPFLAPLGTFALPATAISTSFGVPNNAALSGQPFVVQGVAVNTALVATNATAFTIR